MIFSEDVVYFPFQQIPGSRSHSRDQSQGHQNKEKMKERGSRRCKGEGQDEGKEEDTMRDGGYDSSLDECDAADNSDIRAKVHIRKIELEKRRLEQLYRTSSNIISAADWTVVVRDETVDWSKYMAAQHARVSDIVSKAVEEKSRRSKMEIVLKGKEHSLPIHKKIVRLPSIEVHGRGREGGREKVKIRHGQTLMNTGEREERLGQGQGQGQGEGQKVKSKSNDEYEAGLAVWKDKFDRFKDHSSRQSTLSTESAYITSKNAGNAGRGPSGG